ncbi:MAG TPA: DUF2799 domain-containing protein [Steroidobacteraceae bacterium]|nr:DUF2799 domain-containing protein [Steroidobacteraceae bacterium]
MNPTTQVSRAVLALLALASLGGCASLSESECRMSDWYDIGFADGRQGRPSDHINRHVKACGEHGLAPDRERYRDGHFSGLESYCTPHNGLAAGRSGNAYYGVCANHDERGFMAGYSLGNTLHRAYGRLHSVDSEISSVEAKLKDKETTDEDRAVAIYRRVQLEGERGAARVEVDRLEWEVGRF